MITREESRARLQAARDAWLQHLATCPGCSATKTTVAESPEFAAHADQALGLDA